MRRPATVAATFLALASGALAQEPETAAGGGAGREAPPVAGELIATAQTLEELGFDDAAQRYSTDPAQQLWFHTRDDQVPVQARLSLDLDEDRAAWEGIEALEVAINGEPVARISAGDVIVDDRPRFDLDARLLGDDNALTMRLEETSTGVCLDRIPRGSWSLVEGGSVEIEGTSLGLAADLALLPLPFLDVETDREVVVPVAFAAPPDAGTVRVAGLLAGYFGTRTSAPVAFEVHIEELPPRSAVVLDLGDAGEQRWGLEPAGGPTLAMVDHPGEPRGPHALLLIRGRDLAELETAMLGLLEPAEPLQGPRVVVEDRPSLPDRVPYDAPRWLPPEPRVQFADIEGGGELVHRGLSDGTLEVDFRIAPDLFAWPDETLRLTVDYTHVAPSDDFVPRIDVELNGRYVETLRPPAIQQGMGMRSAELPIHRTWLRGFNRLEFHVSWPDPAAVCDRDPDLAATIETRIEPTSTLHLEGVPHFTTQPDVASFVEDGFPLTRMADLSDTVLVLPDALAPGDVASALSVLAHLAAITGVAGHGLEVATEGELAERAPAGADLLVVGNGQDLLLLREAETWLPLTRRFDRLEARAPGWPERLAGWTAGRRMAREASQVQELLSRNAGIMAVMGTRSPYDERHTRFVITAPRPEDMPRADELRGFTVADEAVGDVLLARADRRWRFAVGPRFDTGELAWPERARWLGARHWLLLLPSCLLAALAFSSGTRSYLSRRARARLDGKR